MRMHQVMINLLTNALKFSKKSSQVIVRIDIKGFNESKDLIEIQVKDTGIGINSEDIS
jgi:signal transduction histidine kinase